MININSKKEMIKHVVEIQKSTHNINIAYIMASGLHTMLYI